MDQKLYDEVDSQYYPTDTANTDDWDIDCQQFDLGNGDFDTMLDKLVDQLPRVPESNWNKSLETELDDSYIDEWLVDNYTSKSPDNTNDSGVYLKSEPLSPSNNSVGSSSSYQLSNTSTAPSPNSDMSIKIETPPITPPQNHQVCNDIQHTNINSNSSYSNVNKLPPVSLRKIPLAHNQSGSTMALEEEIVNKPLNAIDTAKLSTMELKAYKKLQRKIKNRESACLSRKKKKEYLQSLETELNQQAALCNRLKSENMNLKLKIQQLEQENVALRQHQQVIGPKAEFSSTSKKSTTALFIILLFVGLNLTALNFMNGSAVIDETSDNSRVAVLRGRTLLSENREQSDIIIGRQSVSSDNSKLHNEIPSSSSGCSPTFNKTETQRISRKLLKWHQRQTVEYNYLRKNAVLQNKEAIQKLGSNELAIKLNNAIPGKESVADNTQIVPYYGDFFSSAQDYVSKMFNQSVDTFYVVTFKKDLYLFPPTTGKKIQKQRLSLIMPAFNETYMTTMVKIDCEISNMTFVKLNIPSILTTDRFSRFQSVPSVL